VLRLRVQSVLAVTAAAAEVRLVNPRLIYVDYSLTLLVQGEVSTCVKTADSKTAWSVGLESQMRDFCVAETAILLHNLSDVAITDTKTVLSLDSLYNLCSRPDTVCLLSGNDSNSRL